MDEIQKNKIYYTACIARSIEFFDQKIMAYLDVSEKPLNSESLINILNNTRINLKCKWENVKIIVTDAAPYNIVTQKILIE